MVSDEKRRQNLNNLLDHIDAEDGITTADAELLTDFSDRLELLRSEYGVHRHEKLLRHLYIVARDSPTELSDVLDSREAAEDAVRWINREKTGSEETNRDYRVSLRVFGKRLTDGDGYPESLRWIPATTPSDYDPTPSAGDMISRDEMERLVDAAQNPRDAAFVAVAWDSGCRSGEFRDLSVGDVSDHKHGLSLHVDGKRGERNVTLIPSVPYLRQWLNFHPSGDSEAPLWSKLDSPEKPSFRALKDVLERLKRRTDAFTKPVNLTNFRKSRASDLASRGMSQAHLEDRMGWTRGSDAASRYISVFAEESTREFARLEGVEVEEETVDPDAPLSCPRCDKETPQGEDVCMWCGQALSAQTAQELDSSEERLFESVVAADDEDLVESLRAVRELLSDAEVRALLARDD